MSKIHLIQSTPKLFIKITLILKNIDPYIYIFTKYVSILRQNSNGHYNNSDGDYKIVLRNLKKKYIFFLF